MKKIILINLLFTLALATGVYFFVQSKAPRLVYVVNGELYNGFTMKKELESKYVGVQQQRKTILDSLELLVRMRGSELQLSQGKDEKAAAQFQQVQQEYLVKKQQFDEDDRRMYAQYDEQIWKQLNQYVQDYGKEKNCQYVLGASGDGSIMYAQDAQNVTEEVKLYVNNRYKGAGK